METVKGLERNGRAVPMQVFNGKEYRLYPGERYFSRGTKRLHRVVWEFYNGKIPKGYAVHHKDENPANNEISNLELMEEHSHLSLHAQQHVADEGMLAKMRQNMAKANEAAKEWHHSEEGRKWHSEHAKQQAAKLQYRKYICQCCGREYYSKVVSANQTRFCSNKCKSKWRRDSHIDDETRVCEWCGKEFTANKYSKKRFCCKSCAEKYNHPKDKQKANI